MLVWIAEDFRDEHRQALDWLNQRTDEDTEFFGVVVEVWRIDGSRPAPHFNMVAAPNEWCREAVRSVRVAKASDKNLRYQVFFQELMDALRERGFTNARKAQLQSWCLFSAGRAQRVQYGATFAQEKRTRIEVYIDNTDRDWIKILFDQLMERKASGSDPFRAYSCSHLPVSGFLHAEATYGESRAHEHTTASGISSRARNGADTEGEWHFAGFSHG